MFSFCLVNVYLLKPTQLEMKAHPVVTCYGHDFPKPGGLFYCPGSRSAGILNICQYVYLSKELDTILPNARTCSSFRIHLGFIQYRNLLFV